LICSYEYVTRQLRFKICFGERRQIPCLISAENCKAQKAGTYYIGDNRDYDHEDIGNKQAAFDGHGLS
jgi:hypothetical protein